jgi:hypothetical protein
LAFGQPSARGACYAGSELSDRAVARLSAPGGALTHRGGRRCVRQARRRCCTRSRPSTPLAALGGMTASARSAEISQAPGTVPVPGTIVRKARRWESDIRCGRCRREANGEAWLDCGRGRGWSPDRCAIGPSAWASADCGTGSDGASEEGEASPSQHPRWRRRPQTERREPSGAVGVATGCRLGHLLWCGPRSSVLAPLR